MKVEVQYAVPRQTVPSPEDFRRWVKAALEGREAELTVRLVNKETISALNRTYRHREGPTNVLSFPFDPPPGIEMDYLGDILLCAPRIQEEAQEQQKPLEAHYAHLTLHGVLHLLGFDHHTPAEAEVMEGRERALMASLGYGDPYS